MKTFKYLGVFVAGLVFIEYIFDSTYNFGSRSSAYRVLPISIKAYELKSSANS